VDLGFGLHREGSGPQGEGPPDPLRSADAKLEKIGSETVNGLETEKYAVTAEGVRGTAWMTPDHVPVRYEGTAREGEQSVTLRIDYTGHRFGSQDASLFELPDGYQPMPSFGGMGVPPGVVLASRVAGEMAQ